MSKWIYKHQKSCTIFLIIIFALSLIPILLIAGFDAAAGDDYNYGALSHQAFISTRSFLSAIHAAINVTVNTWHNWQGTWFDCFLFCLHPEVFSDSAYIIVPYIFVLMQIACFLIFAHHFIAIRWNISGYYWLIIGLTYLLFIFQLVPSQKSAFFWWVGSIHYALPMCLALLGLVAIDRFLLSHKTKDLIFLSIISTAIGGATYPAALLLILGGGLLWLERFVIEKHSNKNDVKLLLPLILESVGLTISILAPGNQVRSNSDIINGAVPSGGPIKTIIESITFSINDAFGYFMAEKAFILIYFIIIGIITYSILSNIYYTHDDDHKIKFQKQHSHPVIFVLIMFLLNASMYAPRLYAGGLVSSGYFNFNFWVFSLCSTGSIVYILGWLISREKYIKHHEAALYAILLLTIIVIAFLGRHGIKKYTDYVCIEYYLSGQAQDYKEQIALQRLLMTEEGIDDVILPEINNEQGPLMHMPVVSDPNNIDNYMTRIFYGKKSCRSIPRDQWIEEYGAKYGY